MNIVFGTDGWRALLDSEINSRSVSVVALAFADYISAKGNPASVAVAYDNRRNSALFAEIFAEVLSFNKVQVYLSAQITPTPVLSWYTKNNNLGYGVMITASHNPPNYNGIKFKGSYGGPFLTNETAEIEKLIKDRSPLKDSKHIVRVDMSYLYSNYIQSCFNFEAIKKSNLKLLIDSMGGTGGSLIQDILNRNGISATTIYSPPSENFYGRLAEPIESNLKPLSTALITSNDFSFGVATDGDADRVGLMDDKGNWISAQETIMILADYLINKKQFTGTLVKTSSVTGKLNIFKSDTIKIEEVQVGFKYICEQMLKEKVIMGAEESGGFGYGFHLPERDGIFSSLLLLSMLAGSEFKGLSEYLTNFRKINGYIHYNRIDFPYEGNNRNSILPSLYSRLPDKIRNYRLTKTEPYYSSRGIINGIKFFMDDPCRWLLLRISETEPLVRIYAEGLSSKESLDLIEEGKNFFYE